MGASIRRAGIHSSSLSRWRGRANGAAGRVGAQKRGPKSRVDRELAKESTQLRHENERLRAHLEQAETIIEVQKKLSQLLGLEMPAQQHAERE